MPPRTRKAPPSPPTNQLRIIGGQWRGRKLAFTDAEGLRPTGDRIRETLFNWLAPHIEGARCLDLFAGSGALGLEALSRGAASCDFVELNSHSARQIQTHLNTLNASQGRVHSCAAATFLHALEQRFDVVFLDPPFHRELLTEVVPALTNHLHDGTLIYLESAIDETHLALPAGWTALKQKQTGRVSYGLYELVDTQ